MTGILTAGRGRDRGLTKKTLAQKKTTQKGSREEKKGAIAQRKGWWPQQVPAPDFVKGGGEVFGIEKSGRHQTVI